MEEEHAPRTIGYAVIFRMRREGIMFVPPLGLTPGTAAVFLSDGSVQPYEQKTMEAGFRREDILRGIELVAMVDAKTGRLHVSEPTRLFEIAADVSDPGPHVWETATTEYSFLWGRNAMDISYQLDLMRRVSELQRN